MPWIWSDPTPSNQTAAALTSNFRVDAPNIGPVIGAILTNRYRQEQERQQLADNILKSLGSLGGTLKQQSDDRQLADYIQSHAPYINAEDSAQLSGMSPEARLKALNYAGQQNALDDKMEAAMQPPPDYGTQPTTFNDPNTGINYILGPKGWTPVPHKDLGPTGGQIGVQQRHLDRQARADLDARIKADSEIMKHFGFDNDILTSAEKVHKGVDSEGNPVPEGKYRLDLTDIEGKAAPKDVSAADFDAAHKALDDYLSALKQRAAMGSGDLNTQIQSITEAYKSGAMSRPEAAARLNALGIPGN